ncbi:hypothetical protein GQ457_01G030780 [Hibiscus cannabinus]
MEVHITSKEMVKPFSQQVYLRKPFSLSLLDQFIPAHYTPLLFNARSKHINSRAQCHSLHHLKHPKKMEVHITSKEMVKPFSQQVYLQKPFSLSLLDQFIPAHYTPLLFFYAKPVDSRLDTDQILARLKTSLSKALDHFYPLAGRTIDNLYVGSYDKGVPYVEARVTGRLADFIARTEQGWTNRLLPCQSFCSIPTSTSPHIALQINIFDCGGIAIGMCGSHKLVDASTGSAFLKCWTALYRGSHGGIPDPDMIDAGSRLFPPLESIPQNYLSSIETIWFQEGWHTTRRFVFDEHAVATLKLKAKSKSLNHPSRTVTLAAFLWKHAMLASRAASGRLKPSVLTQSVNLRQRMKPKLPEYTIGNLYTAVASTYNSTERDVELQQLAYLVREAMVSFNDQMSLLQSGDALKFMTDQHNELAEIAPQGEVDFFDCTSWLNTLDEVEGDFGWGPPVSVSRGWSESRYYSFANAFVLKATGQGNGVEAMVTLDAKAMDNLEHDPDFLAFVSPDSKVVNDPNHQAENFAIRTDYIGKQPSTEWESNFT